MTLTSRPVLPSRRYSIAVGPPCGGPAAPGRPAYPRCHRRARAGSTIGHVPPQERSPMPDQRFDRIHEFIAPLRVKPGSRVRLPEGLRPPVHRRLRQEGAGDRAAGAGRRVAERVPDAARRAGHVEPARHLPGDGRGRQGRHDPARDERRQPAGRRGDLVQGPQRAGARPRLPVAHRDPAAGPRDDRHLQPLLLRGDARRPRPSLDPRGPEDAEGVEGQGRVAAPVPRDQRLGALPHRQRHEDRQAVPQRLEGRAEGPVPRPGSTSRSRTGSSAPRTRASGGTGTTTRRRSRTCSRTPRRRGRRGT